MEAIAVKKKKKYLVPVLLLLLPFVIFTVSLSIGRFPVSLHTIFSILSSKVFVVEQLWSAVEETVILQVRFSRLLLAMLIGAGLSIAGASFQGMFGNPLVSPHILGVSSGAGFRAALGLLLFNGMLEVQILSLVFGLIAIGVTYLISRIKGASRLFMLVLSGIIVSALFQALISLVKYLADPEEKLPTIVYWLMGSLTGASYHDLFLGGPFIIVGIAVLWLLRWRINILSLSEDEAKSMGINVPRLRLAIILASTVITAVSVSLCGIVGWIGLVIPHIGRMIVGNDHRILLPACVSIGAMYLMIIDNLARTLIPMEIPLSILTAIIGAPFFAFLLRKTGGGWS